jgi:hypothetical protein
MHAGKTVETQPMVREHILRLFHEENEAAVSTVIVRMRLDLDDDLRGKLVAVLDEMADKTPDALILQCAMSEEKVIRAAWRAGIEKKLTAEVTALLPSIISTTDAMIALIAGNLLRGRT